MRTSTSGLFSEIPAAPHCWRRPPPTYFSTSMEVKACLPARLQRTEKTLSRSLSPKCALHLARMSSKSPSGYSCTSRKWPMPGVQVRRSIISRSSLGSVTRVSISRLSHSPSTRRSGSRSRSTVRMFFASWRMKRLRTGRLLMVISWKTLTMSFIREKAQARREEKKGRNYTRNCSRLEQPASDSFWCTKIALTHRHEAPYWCNIFPPCSIHTSKTLARRASAQKRALARNLLPCEAGCPDGVFRPASPDTGAQKSSQL